ncbi:MAG: hypothetical protein RPT25_02350 [Cycloclasticus sp.]|jgi:hypothetical protein
METKDIGSFVMGNCSRAGLNFCKYRGGGSSILIVVETEAVVKIND